MPRLLYATLGALITVYATFLPTFLTVRRHGATCFVKRRGGLHIEWLSGNRRLQAALTGVTAAVVGVIGNLAVFFGLRVLFPETGGFAAFAAVPALATFAILRRFRLPTYGSSRLARWLACAGYCWQCTEVTTSCTPRTLSNFAAQCLSSEPIAKVPRRHEAPAGR